MRYTEQEERELNHQLRRWQKRQITAVRQNNTDSVFDKMTEIDKAIWEKIANADTHRDVNWGVWKEAENVISKYCKMAQ